MWDFYLLTDKRSVKIKEMIVSDIWPRECVLGVTLTDIWIPLHSSARSLHLRIQKFEKLWKNDIFKKLLKVTDNDVYVI